VAEQASTPEPRLRQPQTNTRKCGIQPAYKSLLNRRLEVLSPILRSSYALFYSTLRSGKEELWTYAIDDEHKSGSYRGSGSASYHPRMLLGILVYGYATGVFSSRKLERATYDSVAFRFIAANDHPDHDTIAAFSGGFSRRSRGCSFRCCCLRARWAC